MKKVFIVLAAVVLCASIAVGQSQTKPVVYVGGGIGMPLSPAFFKDYWKMGINFGGGVGITVGPKMELIGKVHFYNFPSDMDKLLVYLDIFTPDELAALKAAGIDISGMNTKFLAFGADFKYSFSKTEEIGFQPYSIVGLEMVNIKYSDLKVSGGGAEISVPVGFGSVTKFGFSGGLGFDYMFSPTMGFWLNGRVGMVLTEGDSFTYLPFQAGLKFMFGK